MTSDSSNYVINGGEPVPEENARARCSMSSKDLSDRYRAVRDFTTTIREPLTREDCVAQSMPDVSPTNWHLAHTTWFFETLVLARRPSYRRFSDEFAYLYNSYYNSLGAQFPRDRRGVLTRPGLREVTAYREHVDRHLLELLDEGDESELRDVLHILETGLHHEQQHQELMLTDIKHVLSCNPLGPVYRESNAPEPVAPPAAEWLEFDEGLHAIGHDGGDFCYDNETPRHRRWLEPFAMASQPVTNAEFLEFIDDGGYRRAELWLSAGWNQVLERRWKAPLYWIASEDSWRQFTLSGIRPLDPAEPVCHVSYFEADAFARWAGARLPTEAEWEVAASAAAIEGNFVRELLAASRSVHPSARPADSNRVRRVFGDVWEWTASPYAPYPGYRPIAGPLGEYNGKFMCNQYVLRGGSCATSRDHMRVAYRNFFPPEARWQFSGIRLARDPT